MADTQAELEASDPAQAEVLDESPDATIVAVTRDPDAPSVPVDDDEADDDDEGDDEDDVDEGGEGS